MVNRVAAGGDYSRNNKCQQDADFYFTPVYLGRQDFNLNQKKHYQGQLEHQAHDNRKHNKKVKIVSEICIGCGECILPCRDGAIKIKWDADTGSMQEKMVEHVYATLQKKKGKYIFISFLTQISPACDCYPASDTPVVEDIGILISKDPVAIDQTSADLVNNQSGNRNSKLTCNFEPGEDKFRGVYPDIDWTVQLKYGEEIGLGSREYELIKIG